MEFRVSTRAFAERPLQDPTLTVLLRYALLCALWLCADAARALEVDPHFFNLDDEFEYLVDHSGRLQLDDLLAEPDAVDWQSSAESKPGAGFHPVWLRIAH